MLKPSVVACFGLLFSLFPRAFCQEIPASRLVRMENAPKAGFWVEDLGIEVMEQDWGRPMKARSVGGRPLKLKGEVFKHGIGSHAEGELNIKLHKEAERFVSLVGIDDEVGKRGSVVFIVLVDGKEKARTKVLKGGMKPVLLDVDLKGAEVLSLVMEDGGDGIDYDHADWAGAVILMEKGSRSKPKAFVFQGEKIEIAMGTGPEPRINNPRITGATPGMPFLFRIPASGEHPLSFEAEGLPPGLSLDKENGIISGKLGASGFWDVKVKVSNRLGTAEGNIRIVGGKHKLALTPPMGWNSWNVWGLNVSQEKVKAAADLFVEKGLVEHGYQYINIDDAWENGRNEKGEILPNKKFPDMKGLADYVHGLGLKLGIYSSPGPKTCGRYEGSYKHEFQDAKTWAEWGIDYLKYDWCSYGRIVKDKKKTREILMAPYKLMRKALDECGRDIVFSLCQYGMGKVWEWGKDVGGNLWRTTGDIRDTWNSMSRIGFGQAELWRYSGPGHWNDPDMLVVGYVGWGSRIHPTRLSWNGQVTHMTLWCILCAPLLLGCDLSKLDDSTLALITNEDPLGKQAKRIKAENGREVWAKPLSGGSVAVAFFNRGRYKAAISITWKELGLEGPQRVRNLWTHMELGTRESGLEVRVPRHGAMLFKLTRK